MTASRAKKTVLHRTVEAMGKVAKKMSAPAEAVEAKFKGILRS